MTFRLNKCPGASRSRGRGRGRKRKLLNNFRNSFLETSRGLANDCSDIDSPDERDGSETRTAQQKVHITSLVSRNFKFEEKEHSLLFIFEIGNCHH